MLFQFGPSQKKPFRGRIGYSVTIGVAQIAVVDLLPGGLAGLLQLCRLIEGEIGRRVQIIEQRIHVGIEVRAAPFGVRGDRRQCVLRIGRAKKFPRRQDQAVAQFLDRRLCGGIEQADRLDLIAQKFYADRIGIGGGENIDDAAADAEFAGNFHHRHAPVAQPEQTGQKRLPFAGASRPETEHRVFECGARNQAVHGGGNGRHQQSGRAGAQALQCRHPARDQSDMRRGCFIGQGFPFGKQGQALGREAHEIVKKPQIVEDPFGRFIGGGQDDPRACSVLGGLLGLGQQRQCARCRGTVQACQASAGVVPAQGRAERSKPCCGFSADVRHESHGGSNALEE